jgi:ABC-type Mn2+/Zn2+ transport system ATPase subunit
VAPEGIPQEEISLIKIENVRFSYDEAKGLPFIFDNPISYDIKLGTRVGVMGPNGAGKSTFLKLITGKLQPTSGTITINPAFTLAYFGQHSTKELNLKDTALEFMTASFPKANIAVLKTHLTKTSVAGDIMNTRMGNLSFSQRSCIIFAKLTFVPPHLLIMDEPTNFLDMDSIDSLIGAANKFAGGLVTVTHNRDFLRKCSKHYLSIVPSQFLEFKTMKEAERATYSFISALESGKKIDVKNAIQENRGGGAIHTKEYLEASASRLNEQQKEALAKEEAIQAEAAAIAAAAAEKEAKRLAKVAKQKTDWVAGDECFAPVKNSYSKAVVVRNVPAMGVTVKLESGKTMMCDAKKLKLELPDASDSAPTTKAAPAKKPNAAKGPATKNRKK